MKNRWNHHEARRPSGFQASEAGYTLAMFLMVIAVMAIMTAAAVEILRFQSKREKEAELIFRGEQYVEAIRLYRQKYGRYPMRMKELWEADPKVLRKKWTDPITGKDTWGVIFKGQEGQELGGQAGPAGMPLPTPTRTPIFERQRENEGEKVGPIVGVHSLSTKTSIKIYEGRDKYNLWKFVLKDEVPPGQPPGGGGGDQTPWGQVPPPATGPGTGGGTGGGTGQPPGGRPGDRPYQQTPWRGPTGTPWPGPTGTPHY